MANKSINIKEEILEYAKCSGFRCPHEISEEHYIIIKDDLDRMEREVREETEKETIKSVYKEVIKNGSADRTWTIQLLIRKYKELTGIDIPKKYEKIGV